MRYLFVLRGAPASGKSTWLEKNNLTQYTLSADKIRLMFQGPVTTVAGGRAISQDNDTLVWGTLFDLLEKRMSRGELVIVDATHYKAPLINRYADLVDKYRYRVYVVDFADIPVETLLERNAQRGEYQKVPEEVIQKMVYSLQDTSEVRSAFKIITREEAEKMLRPGTLEPVEVTQDKVVVFGDIHGCYEPLKTYFKKNPFDKNTCYIFCGDYLDRGLQNKEVLEFLMSIYKEKNVFLLEGNHEKWLKIWCSKEYEEEKQYDGFYRDFFAIRYLDYLDNQESMLQKKINKLQQESELVWEQYKEENPDIDPKAKKETYWKFEKIDVIEYQKQLNQQKAELNTTLEQVRYYAHILKHEVGNSSATIRAIQDLGARLGNEAPKSCVREVEKYLPVRAIKFDNAIKSKVFLNSTVPQIRELDKAQLRQFCRKFAQMSYFKFNEKEYLVTHAGVSAMPDIYTAASEFVEGVGGYSDAKQVDLNFRSKNDVITIHGHRNLFKDHAALYDEGIYNLCSEIEYGEPLRILEITKDGRNIVEIENPVYSKEKEEKQKQPEEQSDIEILKSMLESKLIQVKNLENNIISLNFTREAFTDRKWNDLSCKARGLFVNKHNGDVIARSYTKFFNWGETDACKSKNLCSTMIPPYTCYRKENGFLSLISNKNGQIYIFTKSSDDGDYVNWFKAQLCKWLKEKSPNASFTTYDQYIENYNALQSMKKENFINDEAYLKRKEEITNSLKYAKLDIEAALKACVPDNHTVIFECVDNTVDPHIIEYPEPVIFVLDIVKNQLKDEFWSYEDVKKWAQDNSFKYKVPELVFEDWDSLYAWRQEQKESYKVRHEGWVIQDSNNFRVKMKSRYYQFWKSMRAVLHKFQHGSNIKKIYATKEEIAAVKLMQEIPREEIEKLSIIDIEKRFYDKYPELN